MGGKKRVILQKEMAVKHFFQLFPTDSIAPGTGIRMEVYMRVLCCFLGTPGNKLEIVMLPKWKTRAGCFEHCWKGSFVLLRSKQGCEMYS